MIFISYKYNNDSLIDYGSLKSRQVVRSVLGEETVALADASDVATLIKHDAKSILKRNLKIAVLIDSATLFNLMKRNSRTTKNTHDRHQGNRTSLY